MSSLIDLNKNPSFLVSEWLDNKNNEILEEGLPVAKLTDDVAFEFDTMDIEIEKLKDYKKSIEKHIKELEHNKLETSSKCAEWFINNGIEKLEGVAVSSITINKKTEAKTVSKSKFVSILNKKQIEELLIKEGLGKYETEEVATPEKLETLRINKRR